MILYGTKATHRKTEYIADSCPACGTSNTMQMNVFQRYAHIYWIPFFPIGKTGVSQCNGCQQVLKFNEMTPALKMSYYNIKKQIPVPFWTFSGALALVVIFAGAAYAGRQKSDKVSKMITALKKDDILHVKLKDNAFTLLKINKVAGDSIYFVANKYQTNLESGIDDLEGKEYESEPEVITTAELQAMDKKDQILDVERN